MGSNGVFHPGNKFLGVFTIVVCIVIIVILKFCALDVFMLCFQHFIPRFNNLFLFFWVDNNV
jgi:hypothetical protein